MPYSNIAYSYNLSSGESGKLIAEFWITPFDKASAEGPEKSVESVLSDNKKIGLSEAVIDYDDVNDESKKGFEFIEKPQDVWKFEPWNSFYTDASGRKISKAFTAQWSFVVTDSTKREVAFKDESRGAITSRHWDFGDGTSSTEQNPAHQYKEPGKYIVILDI